MDFKVGDLVKIINEKKRFFNQIGTIVESSPMKFNKYFKILFKTNGGEESWCYAKSKDLLQVITEDSIKGTAKKIIDKESVTSKVMTPIFNKIKECYDILGIPFTDEELHNFKIGSKEMEQILINEDRILKDKAKAYDLICEKMFMASGVIEDGDDIKWIIDPEVICSVILKIILNDVNIDRDKIVKDKKVMYSNIIKDGDSW
jgi:hypothetical protein